MLPAEVLVEAAQRLAGALDHLLDGEVLARALVEELDGGVEEALHPALRPEAGRVQRAAPPPGRAGSAHRVRSLQLANRSRSPWRAYLNLRDRADLIATVLSWSSGKNWISERRCHCSPPGRLRAGGWPAQGPAGVPSFGSDGRLDDHVQARRSAVGDAGLAPHLDRERCVHQRVAEPEQAGGVVGQRVEVEAGRGRPWRRRAAGRRRRRTTGARPWCSTAAWRSARSRSRSDQALNGSRSENSGGKVGIGDRAPLRTRPRCGPASRVVW